jgi:type IX secretion system PorP/SprF family membrane protein
MLVASMGSAQYFQFSQYNFATQRVNPAYVAASDYASISFDYRSQSTGGDFNLRSNIFSAAYPFLKRKNGKRWAGLGISFMDDRSGHAGIFNTQEIGVAYAGNVFLSKYQTLSLGVKGLYSHREFDLTGLHTGAQYVADRGFDESVFNGENFQSLRLNYITASAGLYWQQTDRNLNKIAYWGVSFFDFNKPKESFSGRDSRLGSSIVAQIGLQVYQKRNIAVMPELLFTRNSANQVFNLGATTRLKLGDQSTSRIDLLTKYVLGRSGIIGLQLHQENFSIGCSYDFPAFKKNAGNLGAFEFGLELRKLVNPRLRAKKLLAKRKIASNNKPATTKNAATRQPVKRDTMASLPVDSTQRNGKENKNLRNSLQAKQDSIIASAEAGKISHEPLVIERVTLHFNFEFGSTDLDEDSQQQMDDLSEAMHENEHLKITLTGHTDNIGSIKFNQRLSLFRAEVIKEYLVKKGVDPSRITTEGKGLSEPLNENKTEEERSKNRRVVLTIFYQN